MSGFKDVSGHPLEVGDKVAYCLGGKGTVMRVGVIGRLTEKSVILAIKEARQMYNPETRRYDKIEWVDGQVIRAFDSVSKVFPVEVAPC